MTSSVDWVLDERWQNEIKELAVLMWTIKDCESRYKAKEKTRDELEDILAELDLVGSWYELGESYVRIRNENASNVFEKLEEKFNEVIEECKDLESKLEAARKRSLVVKSNIQSALGERVALNM